jgi:hypothetical protein
MLQRSIRILRTANTFNLYYVSRDDPLSRFPEKNVPRIADGCNGLVWVVPALCGHGERCVPSRMPVAQAWFISPRR